MTNVKRISLAMLLAATFVPFSASAQTTDQGYDSLWYVSPGILGIHPDKDFGVDRNGPGASLRFGKEFTHWWDFQGGISYGRANNNGLTYDQTNVGVDALLMLSRSRVRPFLLFGTGLSYELLKSDRVDFKDYQFGPYAEAGLGLQFALSERAKLQLDVRHVRTYWRDINPTPSKNNYVNLGLNFAIGTPPAPVAQVTLPPAPLPAPAPRFEKVTLGAQELFEFNSATLSTGSAAPSGASPQSKLDEIAEALRNNPDITNVAINGYSDRLGSKKYNLQLSQKRAEAVKDYLTSKGIDPSRMVATGKGEADPLVECTQQDRAELISCLAPNRRVEIENVTVQRRVE
jgi:OOP family OmpA-OmpF porin